MTDTLPPLGSNEMFYERAVKRKIILTTTGHRSSIASPATPLELFNSHRHSFSFHLGSY
jgi:hypothetical protein